MTRRLRFPCRIRFSQHLQWIAIWIAKEQAMRDD